MEKMRYALFFMGILLSSCSGEVTVSSETVESLKKGVKQLNETLNNTSSPKAEAGGPPKIRTENDEAEGEVPAGANGVPRVVLRGTDADANSETATGAESDKVAQEMASETEGVPPRLIVKGTAPPAAAGQAPGTIADKAATPPMEKAGTAAKATVATKPAGDSPKIGGELRSPPEFDGMGAGEVAGAATGPEDSTAVAKAPVEPPTGEDTQIEWRVPPEFDGMDADGEGPSLLEDGTTVVETPVETGPNLLEEDVDFLPTETHTCKKGEDTLEFYLYEPGRPDLEGTLCQFAYSYIPKYDYANNDADHCRNLLTQKLLSLHQEGYSCECAYQNGMKGVTEITDESYTCITEGVDKG